MTTKECFGQMSKRQQDQHGKEYVEDWGCPLLKSMVCVYLALLLGANMILCNLYIYNVRGKVDLLFLWFIIVLFVSLFVLVRRRCEKLRSFLQRVRGIFTLTISEEREIVEFHQNKSKSYPYPKKKEKKRYVEEEKEEEDQLLYVGQWDLWTT